MADEQAAVPDQTAIRVALWRALHVEIDPPPHVLADEVGLRLADPPDGWRARPDMDPEFTAGFRAAIAARARFIEDLVIAEAERGVGQYVILGAGLDTFAQRRPEVAARLIAAGFDPARSAVIVSTGVSMYLSHDANAVTLRQVAGLAPGSTLALSFFVPISLVDPADRPGAEMAARGAAASGTPFVSYYTPDEIVSLALDSGFKAASHVSGASLRDRYFAGRADGLRPSTGEDLLVATT